MANSLTWIQCVCLLPCSLVFQDYYDTNSQFPKGTKKYLKFFHGSQFVPLHIPGPVDSYQDQFVSMHQRHLWAECLTLLSPCQLLGSLKIYILRNRHFRGAPCSWIEFTVMAYYLIFQDLALGVQRPTGPRVPPLYFRNHLFNFVNIF